ncbi:hypothetical protein IAT40_000364 [Kwoniella sp. CBS 6097]
MSSSRSRSTYLSTFFLIIPFFAASVSAFSFSTSTPQQCSDFTIQWSGGTPPYQLVMVPTITITGGRIINITIPDNLSSPYSYTFELEEPTGLEFLVAMSDSNGFGTGGTTSVLTVGSSTDSSCLPGSLNYDFFFSLNPDSNPTACSSMSISWPDNATEPVGLYGLIPHGSAWSIPIEQSSTSYNWQVDIQSETRFLLFMSDNGPYQTGGSSPLYQVQSGETGCINDNSPKIATGGEAMTWATSASSHAPSASVSGVGGTSSGGSNEGTSSKNTGAIVGGTVGGVAFLVLLAILLFFCVKRRARNRSDRNSDPGMKSYGIASGAEKGRRSNQIDLVDGNEAERGRLSGDESPDAGRQVEMNGDVYEPSPFRYPSPPETPSAGVGAALAGAGTGTGGRNGHANNRASTIPPSLLNTPEMLAMAEQKGARSPTSPTTNFNNNNNRPAGDSASFGRGPGSSGAPPTEASNQATVGHHHAGGAVAGGNSSIRKTPSSQHLGGPAGAAGPGGGAGAEAGGNGHGQGNEGTRFVLHEDAGEVVDLPPRYDQLRTRNPDQSA